MNLTLQDIDAEIKRRNLLDDTEAYKYANRFRKLVEPHNGVLGSTKDYKKAFEDFIESCGYSKDSEFASTVARAAVELYPDHEFASDIKKFTESDTMNLAVIEAYKNLPSDAVDPGDYPNESTGGKAEEKSNKERAEIGEKQERKERSMERLHGPTRDVIADAVERARELKSDFLRTFADLTIDLNTASEIISKNKKNPKVKALRKAVNALRPVAPKAYKYAGLIAKHIESLESTASPEEKDVDKANKDIEEAIDVLVTVNEKAKEIEDVLFNIKDLIDDVIPDIDEEEEEGETLDEDELPEPEDLGEEEEEEEEKLEGEEEEEEEEKLEGEEEEELPEEALKNEEEEDMFGKLVTTISKAQKAWKALSHMFDKRGSTYDLPDDQRAYNTDVTDYPNESTYRAAENASNAQRAEKGRKNIERENAGDYTTSPGAIQDVRKIRAHFVPGVNAATSCYVVTVDDIPVFKASYKDVAGDQMHVKANWETFLSDEYRKEIEDTVKTRGIEATVEEMEGTLLRTSAQKELWSRKIKHEAVKDKNKVKKYYTDAYGDSSYAGEMVKDKKNTKDVKASVIERLKAENRELRQKEVLRAKAKRAISVARKISAIRSVPMTTAEIKDEVRKFMTMNDRDFKILSETIDKLAREVPEQSGIVHNTPVGVETPYNSNGNLEQVTEAENVPKEVTNSAKNPENVVTPPDVQAFMSSNRTRPSTTGVIPQVKTASAVGSGINKLADMFTTTPNKLRRLGFSEEEIAKFNYRVKRH